MAPERGLRPLLLRLAASLAAAGFLFLSAVDALGLHLPDGGDKQAKVVRHEHHPSKREELVRMIERAAALVRIDRDVERPAQEVESGDVPIPRRGQGGAGGGQSDSTESR